MPEFDDIVLIGGPTTQNMWAIADGNAVKQGRGRAVRVPSGAGEALSARQLVWMAPGDALIHPAEDTNRPLIGFMVADAAPSEDAVIQTDGVVQDNDPTPAWSWTPGAPLYATAAVTPTPGALTETAGSSPPVAIALTATTILILPSGLGG
jgi:hypothetical protein